MNALQQFEDNLRYIRHTLEEAGTFTHVSAGGLVLAGLIGVMAAGAAAWRLHLPAWNAPWTAVNFTPFLLIWALAAGLAAPTAAVAMMRRARQAGMPLWVGPSRRALRAMLPAWIAGALLTAAAAAHAWFALIPPLWLMLHALALLSGASFSIPPVRWMGRALFALGALAAVWPAPAAALLALGLGFGGVHLAGGLYLWRNDALVA